MRPRWLLQAPGNLRARLGALLKIRAPDLSNPSKPTEKELTSAKNWKDSDAAKQRSHGLCRDKAEARRRNHLSYTMIPPAPVVLRSAIVRRRKESGSPWFQSWLPSPRRGHGCET